MSNAGRNTRQREAIRDIVAEAERPLSPIEILDRARRLVPSMSLATVYRAVRDLKDERLISAVELPGESPRYERADKAHHHHFHCRVCGRAYDLAGCPGGVHTLAPAGFEVTGHELTLFGRCPVCVAEAKPLPPNDRPDCCGHH